MKTFEQILKESNPYRDNNKWNTRNLTRWYSGNKPVGHKAENLKDFVDSAFNGLHRENSEPFYSSTIEAFYMIDDNNKVKYRVELLKKENNTYELHIMKDSKTIKEWRTDDEEHAGAMMEYLFGDI